MKQIDFSLTIIRCNVIPIQVQFSHHLTLISFWRSFQMADLRQTLHFFLLAHKFDTKSLSHTLSPEQQWQKAHREMRKTKKIWLIFTLSITHNDTHKCLKCNSVPMKATEEWAIFFFFIFRFLFCSNYWATNTAKINYWMIQICNRICFTSAIQISFGMLSRCARFCWADADQCGCENDSESIRQCGFHFYIFRDMCQSILFGLEKMFSSKTESTLESGPDIGTN